LIDAPLSTTSAAATSGRSSATSGRLISGDIVWVGLLIEGPYHADADADADADAGAFSLSMKRLTDLSERLAHGGHLPSAPSVPGERLREIITGWLCAGGL